MHHISLKFSEYVAIPRCYDFSCIMLPYSNSFSCFLILLSALALAMLNLNHAEET